VETDRRTPPSRRSARSGQEAPPGWFDRLVAVQRDRPVQLLAVVALFSALCAMVATRLVLLTGFDQLLPDSRPSVVELKRVASRTAGVSTVFIVLEGEDRAALRKAGDKLVPALKALGPPWVGEAEDDVRDVIDFVKAHAGLYAKLDDLTKLRDDVEARYTYEVNREVGTNLDDADAPPPITRELIERRLHTDAEKSGEDRFPDGYYQSPDGKLLSVVVRSGISDLGKAREALAKIREVIKDAHLEALDPTIRYGLTGDLAIGVGEYNAINRDLTEVGVAGLGMIVGVVLLFYLRLRTVLCMVLTIGVGLAWTFALTEVTLGHLNIATGFLFTIVGGNGINFGILYMARYLEELRHGATPETAIRAAHLGTWRPTLTAAAAAAGAYGSLLVTDFKGFREFGIIGGAGMLICWAATYLTLPALLILMERILPLQPAANEGGLFARLAHATREGIPYGRPVAFVVARIPRIVLALGLALAAVGAVRAYWYVRADPMEYDLAQVQSDWRVVEKEQLLLAKAKKVTEYIGQDGMAILVDRLDEVAPLKAALEARRDAAPADVKPFRAVHTLQDLVPADQEAKLSILRQLKDRALRVRRRHLIDDATWERLERFLPADDLKAFGINDLPTGIARAFTEKDGTRGRVLYISPTDDGLGNDAHYLLRWADSFRRTELPDGTVVYGSGRAVIYADMWGAIQADMPKAIILSFSATLLVVVASFRARRAAAGVLFALLVGVAWMTGALAVVGVKLNFLNFMALPITFGIGVDYAVNVAHRQREMGDPVDVVRRTGGAVILCSMTTLLGYLALVSSVNRAVRSLGVAAVLGEVTCLLAAVLVLPAALVWARSRSIPSAKPGSGGVDSAA
jgi:predicted RND superfamily exporter protein